MKSFLKNVLANIVAILTIGMLLFGFILFLIVSSALSGSNSVKIKDNTLLTLNFKNKIIDTDAETEISIFDFKKNKELKYYDIINAIKTAKDDKKIKGISIETDDIEAGQTQLDGIRRALEDFKKSGKFVYAYGNVVSQASYYLGSVADQYYLNPAGAIELKGMSSEVVFLKDFAEKYGIGIDVIRHGKFKAAVEPFIRNDISSENREQISVLLNDIWQETSQKIMKSRKLAPEEFKTVVDSLYGIIPDLTLKHRLADKLMQKSEYENMIKAKMNIKKDDDLNKASIGKYIMANKSSKNTDGGEIAVLYAAGEIYNGDKSTDIHSEKYVKYIQELAGDDRIKAVVFRINSPGGSANASDEILFELQQLKKKKPLVVSFGDYAASGGYYVAMAADKIYSEPNTITGSIGVFGVVLNFKNLANRNGVRSDIVSTNANARMYSPISGASAGTLAIMNRNVEQIYKRFVYFVTQNRKKTFEEIDAVGGGRVWSGKRAKEIGLVDELGSLDDAINYAASLAKLKDFKVDSYPAEMDKFEKFLSDFEEEEIAARYIKNKIGNENYQLFEKVSNPKFQNGIQMNMPYKITVK